MQSNVGSKRMTHINPKEFFRRISVAAGISLGYSLTLGAIASLYFTLSPNANTNTTFQENLTAFKSMSLRDLWIMGIIPVALLVSGTAALIVTPFTAWALRAGSRNILVYGSILWIALVAYIIFPPPLNGEFYWGGMIILSIAGLLIIGFIPSRPKT